MLAFYFDVDHNLSITMKAFLLVSIVFPVAAWTTTTSTTRASSLLSMMGSRAADKWSRKQEWLEKRGGTFMSSGEGVTTTGGGGVQSAEVVGGGRIGSLLAEAGSCSLLGRDDTIDPQREGQPIFVATRNDALDGIIDRCPENRRKDLMFLQNGYLESYLNSKGLLANSQALLYLSVTAKGVEPVDGVTAVNPEGLTTATGTHAQALADRLAALGLKCNVVSGDEYRPAMFEKLIWISTYMLVGTAKGCASVGQAGSEHKELVETVIQELTKAVSEREGLAFANGTVERLAAYTDVVADFPCGVKEFEWRNQYFYNLGDEKCPTHNGLLRECAEKGLLGFDLP